MNIHLAKPALTLRWLEQLYDCTLLPSAHSATLDLERHPPLISIYLPSPIVLPSPSVRLPSTSQLHDAGAQLHALTRAGIAACRHTVRPQQRESTQYNHANIIVGSFFFPFPPAFLFY